MILFRFINFVKSFLAALFLSFCLSVFASDVVNVDVDEYIGGLMQKDIRYDGGSLIREIPKMLKGRYGLDGKRLPDQMFQKVRRYETEFLLGVVSNLHLLSKGADQPPLGQLNVVPPPGSGVEPGTAPKFIKDPKLREQYEKSIKINNQILDARLHAARLRSDQEAIDGFIRIYVARLYAQPPADLDQLKKLLEKYSTPDSQGIVDRVLRYGGKGPAK